MKKILKLTPYITLVSYLCLLFFKDAVLADAIIISSLSALCGYRMYLTKIELPDYRAEVLQEVATVKDELKRVGTDVGKMSLSISRGGAGIEKVIF